MPKLMRSSKQQQQQQQQRYYALASYYPTAPTISTTIPTQRKVSEESIYSTTSEDSIVDSCDTASRSSVILSSSSPSSPQQRPLRLTRCSSSVSCLLTNNKTVVSSRCCSPSSSPDSTTKRGSLRLKRPAPSVCLADLLVVSTETAMTTANASMIEDSDNSTSPMFISPIAANTDLGDFLCENSAAAPDEDASSTSMDATQCWGYFVDMLIPDSHADESSPAMASSSWPMSSGSPHQLPYSKAMKRRRIIPKEAPEDLPGFFLAVPTVDDAAFQLSSLTF